VGRFRRRAGWEDQRVSAHVTAVCVVHEILPDPGNDPDVTAIDKRAVPRAVAVGERGLAGDAQCDTMHHGGVDQALYAYADEDARWWAEHLGRPIHPGLFGENLRTSGVDVSGAEVGERWRIGDDATGVLVEVTSPRIPCSTFGQRMGERHWVKRFTEHGAPGAYLRVLTPGTVAAGDPLRIVRRPGHGVTITDVFLRGSADAWRVLLDAGDAGVVDLAPKLREHAVKAVARG
jgi:MOSC domain-containing protein YiiM